MSMRKPRIAWITHDCSATGAPSALLSLLQRRRPAFEHIVVAKRGGPLLQDLVKASDSLLQPGGVFRRVTDRPRVSFGQGGMGSDASPNRRRTRALMARAEEMIANRTIGNIQPALVFANSVASADYVSPCLTRGIPVILHAHEIEPRLSEVLERYRIVAPAEGLFLAACSTAAARDLAAATKVDEDVVNVIPNSVDAARIQELARHEIDHKLPDGPFIVALGTVGPWKGSDMILEVAAKVLRRVDASFVWIGGGPMLAQLRAEAASAGLSQRVKFVGSLRNPYPLMSRARIFLTTSRGESFGIAVAEAMVLGIPIVAFNVSGLPEVIGDDGALIPAFSTDLMSDAIVDILRSPESVTRSTSMGKARIIADFDPERAAEEAYEVVEKALASR